DSATGGAELPRRALGLDRLATAPAMGRSLARGNGAVQKARIIVPVTRATIVLIEVGSCVRALWTRPKPTTSVTQASASLTTLKCLRRLAASSEMFMNAPPETSLSLVAASRQKVQWWRPYNRGDKDALAFRPIAARQILKTSLRFSRAEIFGFL